MRFLILDRFDKIIEILDMKMYFEFFSPTFTGLTPLQSCGPSLQNGKFERKSQTLSSTLNPVVRGHVNFSATQLPF